MIHNRVSVTIDASENLGGRVGSSGRGQLRRGVDGDGRVANVAG